MENHWWISLRQSKCCDTKKTAFSDNRCTQPAWYRPKLQCSPFILHSFKQSTILTNPFFPEKMSGSIFGQQGIIPILVSFWAVIVSWCVIKILQSEKLVIYQCLGEVGTITSFKFFCRIPGVSPVVGYFETEDYQLISGQCKGNGEQMSLNSRAHC